MDDVTTLILYTLGASACIPAGGLLASVERIRPDWLENELRHFIIAFGGGVLLSAVAFVLVPEGRRYLNGAAAGIAVFVCGGLAFFVTESLLGAKKRERPQFSAMLLDYVPESLALGGAFALGSAAAPLLALFIGLQNLPEGFNAYRELKSVPDASRRRILGTMLLLVPLGPLLALAGWAFLRDHQALLGAVMLFASGGILYLIFQDIAPQARMRRHWAPPLGAVLGFGFGMLGASW